MIPNIEALYPSINYPVSRGTQALHSIFPWDHSETWKIKCMIQGVSIIYIYDLKLTNYTKVNILLKYNVKIYMID